MFRIFLDSDQYSFERILCTEKLFGSTGYVCPGGHEIAKVYVIALHQYIVVVSLCFKDLTEQLELQATNRVLEVGSGMGTCAVYMAEVSWLRISQLPIIIHHCRHLILMSPVLIYLST